jgi:hypothetical protein
MFSRIVYHIIVIVYLCIFSPFLWQKIPPFSDEGGIGSQQCTNTTRKRRFIPINKKFAARCAFTIPHVTPLLTAFTMEAMKPAETTHRKEEKHSANRSPQGTRKIPPMEKNIMALGRIPTQVPGPGPPCHGVMAGIYTHGALGPGFSVRSTSFFTR